ncbi:MAG: YebC/PmpR family DNA-binding transcriptional regulator [Planctomycetes bacterium]|nr:YebC/PmpR family DNA-binding transcriptional regulator [Planctomycetota bacterium]
MAGHSHSANIARRKGAVDKKRGKVFSKISSLIISAARTGGGDPDMNLRLRYSIEAARAANMPKDTIERAIKKGTGSKDGDWQELVYEGYAPGGIALMVTCLTDNRHRTAPDIKHIFEKHHGNLGAPGSVAFLFQHRAMFVVETAGKNEEQITELALDVGADDIEYDNDLAVIYAAPADFLSVKAALDTRGLVFRSAELAYVPQNRIALADKDDARRILKLVEALEDLDDVQNVFANYDMPAEWLEELSPGA